MTTRFHSEGAKLAAKIASKDVGSITRADDDLVIGMLVTGDLRHVDDQEHREDVILNTLDDEHQRKLLVAIAETGGQTVTAAARDMLNQGIRRTASLLMNGSAA